MQLSSHAVNPLRRVYDSPDLVESLSSAANFTRFQLPDLLPQLHRALYLDVDTLVQGNVLEVWQHLLVMVVNKPWLHSSQYSVVSW